ncbi:hypothetical protein D3C77_697450 [compost metagenome]
MNQPVLANRPAGTQRLLQRVEHKVGTSRTGHGHMGYFRASATQAWDEMLDWFVVQGTQTAPQGRVETGCGR